MIHDLLVRTLCKVGVNDRPSKRQQIIDEFRERHTITRGEGVNGKAKLSVFVLHCMSGDGKGANCKYMHVSAIVVMCAVYISNSMPV